MYKKQTKWKYRERYRDIVKPNQFYAFVTLYNFYGHFIGIGTYLIIKTYININIVCKINIKIIKNFMV